MVEVPVTCRLDTADEVVTYDVGTKQQQNRTVTSRKTSSTCGVEFNH